MFPTFFIPGGAGLPFTFEGYALIGCGTATFEPANDIANLRVGDLMVWQFNINPGSWNGSNECMTIPSGWTPFALPKYRSNYEAEYSYAMLYRFATADDLSPSTSYTTSYPRSGAGACSWVTIHRAAHEDLPFGSMQFSDLNTADKTRALGVPVPATEDVVHLLWAMQFFTSSGQMPAVPTLSIPIGVTTPEYTYDSKVGWASWDSAIRMGVEVSSAYQDENWIPNENSGSGLSSWTGTNVGAVSRGGFGNQFATFSGSGAGSVRHYWEFEVNLTAGEKYTFSYIYQRNSWNYANGDDSVGISYVDPSSNERGYILKDVTVKGVLNPLSDQDSVWYAEPVFHANSGVPSVSTQRLMIFFTAQESGIHKLRISGIENNTENWTFTTSGAEGWKVTGVGFRRGWVFEMPTQTGASPIYMGDSNAERQALTSGYLSSNDTDGSDGGRVYRALHIAPSYADDFSGVTYIGGSSRNHKITSALRNYSYPDRVAAAGLGSIGQGTFAQMRPKFPAYPTYLGVRRKYYFEATSLGTGTGWLLYLHTPSVGIGVRAAVVDVPNNRIEWYDGTTTSLGGAGTLALNDVIGAMIDFTTPGSIVLTIYKNGVSLGSFTLTSGTNKQWHDDEPWQFSLVQNANNDSLNFTYNLTGPFSYRPSGAVAWAVPNDTPE